MLLHSERGGKYVFSVLPNYILRMLQTDEQQLYTDTR